MDAISRRGLLAGTALATGAGPAAALAACAGPAGKPRPPASTTVGHSGASVIPGADVCAAAGWRELAGKRVGVMTNQTGVLADLTHIIDAMTAAGKRPAAVFGPEHGFRGTAQAGASEGNSVDPRTGIPVYDAYRADASDLAILYRREGINTVVFDVAHAGAGVRFATHTWAMYRAMQAATLTGAAFVVLDRPCLVSGRALGPVLDPAYASGVGMKPIAQQTGMTAGELARMFAALFLPADTGGKHLTDLHVVPVSGLRAADLFADTGLTWVPPSPNTPTPATALTYPGTCMFEGTIWSEGRGTCTPFQTIGAPGVTWKWAEKLNAQNLPGVRFRETYFAPAFDKFAGQTCGGVQLHVTDPRAMDAVRTGVAMLVTAKQLYQSTFGWTPNGHFDKLTGSDRVRTMIDAGASTDEIVGYWQDELARFRAQREPVAPNPMESKGPNA
jgi:uncharacterized protein YbbC (DUF1343 family)